MADEEALTVAEVSRRLRIHPVTLRKWLKAGKVRGVRLGGTKAGWRIPASEVTRVLSGRPLNDDAPKARAASPVTAEAALPPGRWVQHRDGHVSVEREEAMPTLRETRQEKGWSPEELAARSGVPADVIAGLEAGRRQQLAPDDAQAIAAALGLDASTVYELRPSLGLSAVGETGSGEGAKTGAGEPGERDRPSAPPE